MNRLHGIMARAIVVVALLFGNLALGIWAKPGTICEECYGTFSTPAYCAFKENGRIKFATCHPINQTTCTGVRCGSEYEEEEEFPADDDLPDPGGL
jgi:hypothetical protein